ncbi:hypothetical protein Q2360_07950 [Escherichia coli]|nr:hypothetical protein [Escherichia coli]
MFSKMAQSSIKAMF